MKKEKQVNALVVIENLKKEATPISKALSSLSIEDEESLDKAATYLKNLKLLVKAAKEKELKITDPINTGLKEIRSLFYPFYTSMKITEQSVKERMKSFIASQEQLLKKLESRLESGEIKKISTYHKKVTELQTFSDNISVRTYKVVEISNVDVIPRNFLIPDLKAIEKALKAGERVAGCKLIPKKILAV